MHETQLTLVCVCVVPTLRLQLDYISISPSLTVPGNRRSWDYPDCLFWEHFICCPPTRLHTTPLSPFAPCKEAHLIGYNCISCLSSFQKKLRLQHYSWHVASWSLFAQQPALFTKSANLANKKRQNGLEGGRWPRALTRSTDCVCTVSEHLRLCSLPFKMKPCIFISAASYRGSTVAGDWGQAVPTYQPNQLKPRATQHLWVLWYRPNLHLSKNFNWTSQGK